MVRRRSHFGGVLLLGACLLLAPGRALAQPGNPTAQALLDSAWNAADWPSVIAILDTMGSHEATLTRMHQTRLNYGWELLADGQCAAAHSQFALALGLMPGDADARQGLAAAKRHCPSAGTAVDQATPQTADAPRPRAERTPPPAALPAPAAGPTRHVVQRGETLFGLAQRYGISVADLQRANNLTDDTLLAGQTLAVPSPDSVAPAPGQLTHVVRPHDTLFSIARRYGTTVAALQDANRLSTDRISIDQRLVIPTSSGAGTPRTHRVAPGDTLFSLARRYGVTVEGLLAANGLDDDHIVIGALLIIP